MTYLSIKGVAWSSSITDEMITHLSDNEISLLINSLNDAAEQICNDYEIK